MPKKKNGDSVGEASSAQPVGQSSAGATISGTNAKEEELMQTLENMSELDFRRASYDLAQASKTKFDEIDAKMQRVIGLEPKMIALIDSYERMMRQVQHGQGIAGVGGQQPVNVDIGQPSSTNPDGTPKNKLDLLFEGLLPRMGDEIGKTLMQMGAPTSAPPVGFDFNKLAAESFMEDIKLTKAIRAKFVRDTLAEKGVIEPEPETVASSTTNNSQAPE